MKKILLYFVNNWPLKNYSSRDNLFYSLLGSFQDREYFAVVISHSLPEPSKLKDIGEYTLNTLSLKQNETLKLSYHVSNVQLAVFDSLEAYNQFSYDVYNKYNKVPQILLLNKFSLLEEYSRKQAQSTNELIKKGTKMWVDEVLSRQQSAIIRSDCSIINSQFVYYKLKSKFDNIIYGSEYFPISLFKEEIENLEYRPFKRRKNFYFIGNLIFRHNIDCAQRLISIWPSIRKQLPSQQLHIFSPYYSPQLYAKKNDLEKSGIILLQQIQDLQELSKYRMLLAPFRYYVDTPSKIIDSWFYHTPVVTTPFGSLNTFLEHPHTSLTKSKGKYLNEKTELNEKQEKMETEIKKYYDRNIIGEDKYDLSFGGLWRNYTDSDFVSSVVELCKDELLWNKCRQIGQQTVIFNHSDEVHFRKILGGIATAQYRRVIAANSNLKKQAWQKYIDYFSQERKSKRNKQQMNKK